MLAKKGVVENEKRAVRGTAWVIPTKAGVKLRRELSESSLPMLCRPSLKENLYV